MFWKCVLIYIFSKRTDIDAGVAEFAQYFPDLVQKIRDSSRPATEAYNWAKKAFSELERRLGPKFQDLLTEFERGLAEYQRKYSPITARWEPMHYLDGEVEYC